MSLRIVRDQWHRVVFMQTNREDVGKRYYEIEVPIAPSETRAAEVSEPFRSYYRPIAEHRSLLRQYLAAGGHYYFVSGAEPPVEDVPVDAAADEEVDES
jgi:type I restriction enzyme M protein